LHTNSETAKYKAIPKQHLQRLKMEQQQTHENLPNGHVGPAAWRMRQHYGLLAA
jgi:hypothetical protein